MLRSWLACLMFWPVAFSSPFLAQELSAQEPTDLKVELRSATGSNRFQIGEVIPLEAVLSSSTPNRYLEPCELFIHSFGYPRCLFHSEWSFAIAPDEGWVDLSKEFPSDPLIGGGGTYEVPSHDLGPEPVKFPYLLTDGYRFDKPGKYTVRLSLEVGEDAESIHFVRDRSSQQYSDFVKVVRDFALEIIPADPEWQKEIIRKGYEAFTGPVPRYSEQPSPEMLQYQKDTQAFCNLATPEAVRVLVKLLTLNHMEVRLCLDHSSNRTVVLEEMLRLQMDPDVGVTPEYFKILCLLRSRAEEKKKKSSILAVYGYVEDRERYSLLSASLRKRGDARDMSLMTLLKNPPQGYKSLPTDPSGDLSMTCHFRPRSLPFLRKTSTGFQMASKTFC
jgi:hypothetical protein